MCIQQGLACLCVIFSSLRAFRSTIQHSGCHVGSWRAYYLYTRVLVVCGLLSVTDVMWATVPIPKLFLSPDRSLIFLYLYLGLNTFHLCCLTSKLLRTQRWTNISEMLRANISSCVGQLLSKWFLELWMNSWMDKNIGVKDKARFLVCVTGCTKKPWTLQSTHKKVFLLLWMVVALVLFSSFCF